MIVVTGASGQLGTAFRTLLGDRGIYLERGDLDLAKIEAIGSTIESLEPSIVINCAAYTNVDDAESNEALAFRINAEAVGELARATSGTGAQFVTISTDYVFDGTSSDPYVESDATCPINVYGASKLEGEHLALEQNPDTLIVRTSWVLSGTHPNFVATMLRLARDRSLKVVDDQVGHPTLVDDLARGILRALDAKTTGILHLTNAGTVTWYELAVEAVTLGGMDPGKLTPCTTEQYPTPARRPQNSVLDSERLADIGIEPLPAYRPGLERAVSDLARYGLI